MQLKKIIDFQNKLDIYLIAQGIIPFEYEAKIKAKEEEAKKKQALRDNIIPSEKNDPALQKPRNKN